MNVLIIALMVYLTIGIMLATIMFAAARSKRIEKVRFGPELSKSNTFTKVITYLKIITLWPVFIKIERN